MLRRLAIRRDAVFHCDDNIRNWNGEGVLAVFLTRLLPPHSSRCLICGCGQGCEYAVRFGRDSLASAVFSFLARARSINS